MTYSLACEPCSQGACANCISTNECSCYRYDDAHLTPQELARKLSRDKDEFFALDLNHDRQDDGGRRSDGTMHWIEREQEIAERARGYV